MTAQQLVLIGKHIGVQMLIGRVTALCPVNS